MHSYLDRGCAAHRHLHKALPSATRSTVVKDRLSFVGNETAGSIGFIHLNSQKENYGT
jgi:hypothetical protein